ncbi:hypothetical protein M408DRAFT_156771 [Serendipita vermifera MAFF 305830]|uniref:Uncharacterized protein n=1 Tax=Serendipita vermifera MAFF 305830 TaxID=933852 RepID=A0A0C2XXH4_SERVB|nr:hypothetical protein M408DRAFT_156771 [Serendipita vermifera MAFF 305830]
MPSLLSLEPRPMIILLLSFHKVVHGNDPCGDEIFHLDVTGSEIVWKVNATAGTSIMVALDNGSDEQWSGAVRISLLFVFGGGNACLTPRPGPQVTVTGSDTSCLTSSSANRGSGSSSSSASRTAAYTPPANAASSVPSGSDAANAGTTRAVFGISSALALIGAAVVGVSL